jgi:hypothetical protein
LWSKGWVVVVVVGVFRVGVGIVVGEEWWWFVVVVIGLDLGV